MSINPMSNEGICHKGPLAGLWRDEAGITATIGGRYAWRKDWLCWGWEANEVTVVVEERLAIKHEMIQPALEAA